MSAPRIDRRIERTRQALLRAFIDLLLNEDIEKVTIAAIVARANVGRSTFYTHFRGRDDILKASLSFPSVPLAALVDEAGDSAALILLLEHFCRQRRLARAFAEGSLRRLWVRRLAELIEPALSQRVRRLRARPLLAISLVALAVADAQIALVVHWLASRDPAPAQVMADALAAVTRATVAALLGLPPPGRQVA
jgi:AcrR family transcriptional regulator